MDDGSYIVHGGQKWGTDDELGTNQHSMNEVRV